MDPLEKLLRPLTAVLNRNISETTPARELCRQLDGKTVAIRVRDTALAMYFDINDEVLTLRSGSDVDPHVILTGSLLTLARMAAPPKVLVSASATGFYGDRGDEILDETSPSGRGFLADVARDWEAATEAASAAGIRVVHLRFGVVLSGEGGALAKMLTSFRVASTSCLPSAAIPRGLSKSRIINVT